MKDLKPAIVVSGTCPSFGLPGYQSWSAIVKFLFKPYFVTEVNVKGLSGLVVFMYLVVLTAGHNSDKHSCYRRFESLFLQKLIYNFYYLGTYRFSASE